MNVKLLRRVRDYIAKHPEKYNQAHFCGSECCVAGTALFVSRRLTRKSLNKWGDINYIEQTARELLDLGFDESRRLFSATWHCIADGRFTVRPEMDPVERSRIAVKRINHFIKTGGAQ